MGRIRTNEEHFDIRNRILNIIRGRELKVREKLMLMIIPTLVLGFSLVTYFGYTQSKRTLMVEYQTNKEQVRIQVENAVKLINDGFSMLDRSMEDEMARAINDFREEFVKAGSNPATLDLGRVKTKIGKKFEYMIIDDSTTIIKSTIPAGLNFNFMKFDSKVGRQITKIRLGEAVAYEHLRTNVGTGFLSKFAYVPTKDHKYVLELAYEQGGSDSFVKEMDPIKIADELVKRNRSVSRIRIFDVFGYQFVNSGKNYKPTKESLSIVKRAIDEKSYELIHGNEEKSYFYIDLNSGKQSMSDNSKIIEIVFDKTAIFSEMKKAAVVAFFMGFFVVLITILIIIEFSRRITYPITKLSMAARKVAKGDYDTAAERTSNDEIGELALIFNRMTEKIKQNFHMIEVQKEKLEDYNRNLEKKVADRTAELEDKMERIEYLSLHDQLTGLYNRRFFEDELKRMDNNLNLPISIVMLDVNGLKLINDAFGHGMGDTVLQSAAEIMANACREDDVVARIGGDEFVILLPGTNRWDAEVMTKRIHHIMDNHNIGTIKLSVSYGLATKTNMKDSISDIFKLAEDRMYRRKLSESKSMHNRTIEIIMKTLHEKSEREKKHSERVSHLCKSIGKAMNLGAEDIRDLVTTGLMHDIGKIAIDLSILDKPGMLNEEERAEIERHPEQGYQIMRSINEFAKLAEFVLSHHERWDGKGYPSSLSGEEIPLGARIIAVADAYDAMTSDRAYRKAMSHEQAIEQLEKNAGTQFDPEIVRVFIENGIAGD